MKSRQGFTLLEVAVALGLLAAAIAALSQLVLAAASAGRDARQADLAGFLARERVEQLRALAWGYETDGSTREDISTDLAGPAAPAPGAGLTFSPPDALERDTPGFVDYLDDWGRPVASDHGATAPAFVRRWQVAACPDGPGELLVLRVLVIRGEARNDPAPWRSRGAVSLASLKARRTW